MELLRLDDLYKMVASIYGDHNMSRSATATFTHFVEVCGMLTIHDRKKKREGIGVTDALCKALGWYFPLLSKMRVQSVEELIFRKYPNVCPYCRSAPHQEADCKLVKGTHPTVDHEELERRFGQNFATRPVGLDEWQQMFQRIYPRSLEEHGRSTIALLEELGELAEAIRVFEVHPRYFLGEAADTFSYLMGIANEHSIRIAQEGGTFSFEAEFLTRYPGLCTQCGFRVCACPAVPQATIGRMAKELRIAPGQHPFIQDIERFSIEGKRVGQVVLEASGGHAALAKRLPFDRGDTNRALIMLCLRVAEAVEGNNPQLSETLRAEALRIGSSAQQAGTPKKEVEYGALMGELEKAWSKLDVELKTEIKNTEGMVGELGEILDAIRVLLVFCSPQDEAALRVTAELRAIRECGKTEGGRKLVIEPLPAATATDFRRSLLDGNYDLVHFAGHSDGDVLVFEDEKGMATEVPLTAIAEAIDRSSTVKGVILNACDSVACLKVPIASFTVGMSSSIDDNAAIEFTRGFYDALVRRKSIEDAYREGLSAVRLANFDADYIRLLTK